MPKIENNAPAAAMWNGQLVETGSWPALAGSDWLHFAPGFFETMRVADGAIPLWKGHCARMAAASGFWKAPLPEPGFLLDKLLALTGGTAHGKLRLQFGFRHGKLDWLAEFTPGRFDAPGAASGLKVRVYRDCAKAQDAEANLKSNHRSVYLKARHWMAGQELDEAIVLNTSGEVCDATLSNVWWVESGQVFTPPLSSGPVAGVMRHALMETLRNRRWQVFEEAANPDRLAGADEIFLTNALRGVMVVGEFEGIRKGRKTTDEVSAIAKGLLARPS